LPRLANVISDTDKGKRSLRAKKFASGKPALGFRFYRGRQSQYRGRILQNGLIIVSLNARPGEGTYLPSQGFELGFELGIELGIELGFELGIRARNSSSDSSKVKLVKKDFMRNSLFGVSK
jgi:hypothetical protein